MSKRVIKCSPNFPFDDIVKLLVKNKISGLPVVNQKGDVVGVLSEKDILKRLFPTEKNFYKDIEYYTSFKNIEKEISNITKLKAKDLMTKEIISVPPMATF